ncbi:MAG: 3-deoxy-7-phosphoheptulonate synthase [Verrucomicrobiota bacterium]|nr:3-deoxy-7-phosphoheptulonate synthase [Verrucomicrobiota bacterium]
MIIVFKPHTPKAHIDAVTDEVRKLGYEPRLITGVEQSICACIGDERKQHTLEALTVFPGVDQVMRVQKRYKLVSREGHPADTQIPVDGGKNVIGGKKFQVMAGPCSVESEEQIVSTAKAVKALGATILRGGAYKPRTSPYEFQGLKEDGLKLLALAKKETGLSIITEVLAEKDVDLVAQYTDIFQIGARNAQNFALLVAAARTGKPIMLKRGLSMRIEEWLLAAEYILNEGNPHVMLCERGIRTFETYTRNTLDLSAVAIAKRETHLPVIIDPSQGCGRSDLVIALCKGAVAMGADGLLIEVHPNPAEAMSDGAQQVTPDIFGTLMQEIKPLINAVGRSL